MATSEQIARLRLMVGEPDETTYTEAMLDDRIDTTASLDHAALEIWEEKAAAWAALVNISEGGSNRGMGTLHTNALAMIKHYQAKVAAFDEAAAVASGTRGVVIQRLTR